MGWFEQVVATYILKRVFVGTTTGAPTTLGDGVRGADSEERSRNGASAVGVDADKNKQTHMNACIRLAR